MHSKNFKIFISETKNKLMKLSQARVYGGVGAILSLVGGVVPYAGGVVALVGIILVLVAVKYISEEAKDKSIFNNYLIAFILAIVSVIVAIVALFAFIGASVLFHPSEVRELPHLLSVKLIFSLIAALLIFWILYLISAIFVKNSYYSIAHHTGVDLFHTTGLLYLIGAATLIIFIGAIIIFIAKILEIIAFFSLPEELPKQEL